MEAIAPLSIFSLLIGIAIGLTAIYSLALLVLFVRDWSRKNLW